MRFLSLLAFLCAATLPSLVARAQLPAFPGAEGFGGVSTGGRGGDVYIVTNLNTSGPGSFADAIATVPAAGRTIVFAVSGHIHVNKTSLSASKVTIAGQTAPGDGIGFKDGSFILSGDDVVIRHARFRYGDKAAGGDCINLSSGTLNAILDHVSIQFSTDENLSSYNSPPENLTLQWALNGWGLEPHSCGGLWDQNHATCHHTLWSHNHTRNPKARPDGLLEWINNVTFDWDIGFIMGDSDTPANWKANVRNNYFLAPAGNIRTLALEKASLDRNGNPNFSLYLNNCRHDSNGNGILDGTDKGYAIANGAYTTLAAPVPNTGSIPVTLDDPTLAFKKIVSQAGALRLDVSYTGGLRDEVDAKMVQNLVTQTRQHITTQAELGLANGGFGTLNSQAAPVDSDRDGMPDLYEIALGWNPFARDHNTALANAGGFLTGTTFMPAGTAAGYTRLEEYLHFKAIPHGFVARNTAGNPTAIPIDLAKFTSGFTVSPVFTTSNAVGGTVGIAGTRATFTPTVDTFGRARFDFTVTDAQGHAWTQTCALLVTQNAIPRDLEWKGSGATWDGASAHWLLPATGATVAFGAGDRVAFTGSGSAQPAVSVAAAVFPGSVDVNTAGNYTLNGAGSVGCTGALVKRGTGNLTLSTTGPNAFASVTLEEGSLILGNAGALGSAPVRLEGGVLNIGANAPTGNDLLVAGPAEITGGSGSGGAGIGRVTGSAPLTIRQTNVFDFRGAMTNYTGTIRLLGNSGVRFNGSTGSAAATFDLGAGTASVSKRTTVGVVQLGALQGGTGTRLAGATGTTSATTYEIGANGASTTFDGILSDGGGVTGVTKLGAGLLTFTGPNTYTGATTVSLGGLAVNGSLASAVTVANGAVLRGAGTCNALVTTQAGAQISPGAGPGQVGVLTAAGGLTATSTTFSLQLAGTAGGVSDKVRITGGAGLVGGANLFQIHFAEGVLGAGNYRLVECSAGVPLNVVGGMSMALEIDAPAGTRQSFVLERTASGSSGGYIQLKVTGNAANLAWTGAQNAGAWDLNTSTNFTGATPGTFFNFDSVTFDDTAVTRTVALAGSLEPRLVTVDTTAGYTWGGTGGWMGMGALVKNGSGTLTLQTAHTYSGGTVLNAGSIQLANSIANAGGLGTGGVTLNGGTLRMYSAGDATHAGTLPNDLHVAGNATLVVAPRGGFAGNVTGGGTLNYNTTYVRGDVAGDWSAFTGTVNVTTDSSGGDFRITPSYYWPGLPLASVYLNDKTWFYYAGISNSGIGTTLEIGELAGAVGSHLRGGVTGGRTFIYRIGGKTAAGGESTFAGVIDEQNTGTSTTYIKTGPGIWRLSGSGAWNGATVVESGVLRLWPAGAGTFACKGATTVEPGATLDLGGGAFSTESLALEPGARLEVRDTCTLTGDLNLGGETVVHQGQLSVHGSVVNHGTLRMHGHSTLVATGDFTNQGLLDLLTSDAELPANFVNNGTVILNTERRLAAPVVTAGTFTASAFGHAGHTYQLQRAPSASGPWANLGAARAGADALLTFTDPVGSGAAYYRLLVSP